VSELENLNRIWGRTDLLERIAEEGEVGAPEPVRPFLISGLSTQVRPLLVVTPRSRDAETFAEALRPWVPEGSVTVFPAWEVLPGESLSPTLDTMGRRIRIVRDLSARSGPPVVVTSVRALLQKVPEPPDASITLAVGSEYSLDHLSESLIEFGYERNYLVERAGEFSIRGGILDIYPPGRGRPVRADFFGDEITSLTEFSVSSQRSGDTAEPVEVLPVGELRLTPAIRERAAQLLHDFEESEDGFRREDLERIAAGITFPGMEMYLTILGEALAAPADFLPPNSRVVVIDPKLCRDRSVEFLEQAREWGGQSSLEMYAEFDEAIGKESPLEVWSFGRADEAIDLDVSGWDEYTGRPDRLAPRLKELRRDGATIVIAGGRLATRAAEILAESDISIPFGIAEPDQTIASDASVERGFLFRLNGSALAVVGEHDLFGKRRPAPPAGDETPARAAALILELAPGDHVVHEIHGVGRYHGMVTRHVAGVQRDYLLVEYAGDDRLYVPTDQIEAITKYAGGDAPRLNRLGTGDWERSKSRARRAVAEIAADLAALYAKRLHSTGNGFSPDTPWQGQLEDAFPYLETPDQATAIDDVKKDMERPSPMDRVICGDVGYGKTEIAVRAAFKALQDSKQVAVLVPTTILAQQHTQTFRDRFAGFPVEVGQLSRLRTESEQAKVLEGLAAGKLDLVIGTHRLLQPDVKFHDLGLLVVDEEQRFGVMHKEAIKRLRESVDVITMTATPIPRTLEMALTGVRDMSLVDTPPLNRRPVLTYVGSADARMVTAAIRRELAREGQVFYVHNRVRSIKGAARRLSAMVPGARVEIAHGQMSEGELERVMFDVWDGKVDVLVCTTIIESGLDIPAMNTLIVERADLLGLSQLYQLRGRVGRAGERAYAYFLYPDEAVLTEEAHERLKTLSEFTELGSGFKIALRDLEIRGAGNLLGAEQSGHIAAVGFDLYSRMMAEAVQTLSGTLPEKKVDVRIDLPEDAFVPASYIERESLRMEAYRLIEKVRTSEDAATLASEFDDRYGPVPDPVRNLLTVAELRGLLIEHGIAEVGARQGLLKVRPFPLLSESQQVRLERSFPGATYKEVSSTLLLPVPSNDLSSWVLKSLRAILD
jgi:transcription-repair coupling factor (superfamily II helicase)